MAFLDSTATLAEVKAQYEDTSIYDLSADVVMCKEHIQACRMLISRTADEQRQGSAALRDSAKKYQDALAAATRWLAANDATFAGNVGGGSVRVLSTQGMRDL